MFILDTSAFINLININVSESLHNVSKSIEIIGYVGRKIIHLKSFTNETKLLTEILKLFIFFFILKYPEKLFERLKQYNP